jgi:predicted PurR-regulated permease PerM
MTSAITPELLTQISELGPMKAVITVFVIITLLLVVLVWKLATALINQSKETMKSSAERDRNSNEILAKSTEALVSLKELTNKTLGVVEKCNTNTSQCLEILNIIDPTK